MVLNDRPPTYLKFVFQVAWPLLLWGIAATVGTAILFSQVRQLNAATTSIFGACFAVFAILGMLATRRCFTKSIYYDLRDDLKFWKPSLKATAILFAFLSFGITILNGSLGMIIAVISVPIVSMTVLARWFVSTSISQSYAILIYEQELAERQAIQQLRKRKAENERKRVEAERQAEERRREEESRTEAERQTRQEQVKAEEERKRKQAEELARLERERLEEERLERERRARAERFQRCLKDNLVFPLESLPHCPQCDGTDVEQFVVEQRPLASSNGKAATNGNGYHDHALQKLETEIKDRRELCDYIGIGNSIVEILMRPGQWKLPDEQSLAMAKAARRRNSTSRRDSATRNLIAI